MEETILQIQHLTVGYRRHIVAKNINGRLRRGSITALIGRNGAGKTTLLRTIAGFQKPLTGNIIYKGCDLAQISSHERAKITSVVLTERPHTGLLTVSEVIETGRTPYTSFTGRLRSADHDIILRSMQQTHTAELANRRFTSLSDGERTRVMIARALAQETPLILLDEPTAFLDYVARPDIMNLLRQLAHEERKTILLTTHEVDMAHQICDEVWSLTQEGLFTHKE